MRACVRIVVRRTSRAEIVNSHGAITGAASPSPRTLSTVSTYGIRFNRFASSSTSPRRDASSGNSGKWPRARIRDVLTTTAVRSLVPLSLSLSSAARAERGRTQKRGLRGACKKIGGYGAEETKCVRRLPRHIHASVGGYVRREFLRRISGPRRRRRRRGGKCRYLGIDFTARLRESLRPHVPRHVARHRSRNNSRPGARMRVRERERARREFPATKLTIRSHFVSLTFLTLARLLRAIRECTGRRRER